MKIKLNFMPSSWGLVATWGLCLLLSACGQKGALYFPVPPKPPASQRPADVPAPAPVQPADKK
jgi:predicted small lipoprotein YifL